MADRHRANVDWYVADEKGDAYGVQHCVLAVLMDIRRELRQLNGLLNCPNFTDMPWTLKEIARNTKKKKEATNALVKRRAA